jgi:diacylglycerol kinase (ATP)
MHGKLDYNYISDGIYIGSNQCCQTHFDEKLKDEGIEVDMSLEEDRVDAPFGVESYVWIPVVNHTAPTENQFELAIAVITKWVALGKKMYIHCKNGHGRAPTIVVAYFVSKGKSVDEAIDLIAEKRKSIHLEDVQKSALVNFAKKYE